MQVKLPIAIRQEKRKKLDQSGRTCLHLVLKCLAWDSRPDFLFNTKKHLHRSLGDNNIETSYINMLLKHVGGCSVQFNTLDTFVIWFGSTICNKTVEGHC